MNRELLAAARRHHQAGDLRRAMQLYRQVLQEDAGVAHVWYLAGAACQGMGELDEAVNHFEQALRLHPALAEAHHHLGVTRALQKRLDEAAAHFRRALQLKPAWAEALNNLGLVLHRLGQTEEAAACHRQAVLLDPAFAAAHNNLGVVLVSRGEPEAAAAAYRQALRLKPAWAEVHHNLGAALQMQGKLEEAVTSYRQGLHLSPGCAEAHGNLSAALRDLGKVEEAVAHAQQAIRLKPGYAGGHANLGVALIRQGQIDEAEACFQYALQLAPEDPETHNNLAAGLIERGELDAAEASCRQALRLKPDHADAHWNLSLICLLQGRLDEGWPEYEWRFQRKDFPRRNFREPRWDGSPLAGRTILLHPEQGLGDTLQFIRYAPLVKQTGARVLVDCPEVLAGLLGRCSGIDQLTPQGAKLPAFDVRASLLSLPGLFHTTLETIPAQIPYLTADPVLVERWGRELNHLRALKVGIVWQGSPKNKRDRLRSVALEAFAPLAEAPGVHLVSLQKAPGVEQLQLLGNRFPVTDLGGRTSADLMDAAAVLCNLDLLVTVDTAMAHLAGALGRPVWVLLPFTPDWRWMLDREDSPWYPTMRLFRQSQRGDWGPVFQRIAAELHRLCGEPAA